MFNGKIPCRASAHRWKPFLSFKRELQINATARLWSRDTARFAVCVMKNLILKVSNHDNTCNGQPFLVFSFMSYFPISRRIGELSVLNLAHVHT